jgi:hypothetical protein
MKLREKQSAFASAVARLIQRANAMGYEVTLGDAYRDPRVFGKVGEDVGYGKANSAHKSRLAIDLNLFLDGRYLKKTEDYERLGRWWVRYGEKKNLPLVWGGAFDDGNHFSMRHGRVS